METTPLSDCKKGSCLCGAVRYEVKTIEPKMGHCHCSMCRKFHGAAFATYGEALSQNFQWVSGQDKLQSYTANNGTVREFCGVCGSSLTFAPSGDAGDVVEFAVATLDEAINHRPDAHIFTAYKASWFDINDDLPQYDEGRQ